MQHLLLLLLLLLLLVHDLLLLLPLLSLLQLACHRSPLKAPDQAAGVACAGKSLAGNCSIPWLPKERWRLLLKTWATPSAELLSARLPC